MADYVIYTDSSCDISPALLMKWGIHYDELTFMFDGKNKQYRNYDMPAKTLYDNIRGGNQVITSAVNSQVFEDGFRIVLEKGQDILYIGFSSGLSSTYNNACIAANDLREEFPERKIITVDSLSASAGFGLLLYLTAKQRDAGKSIEEVAAFAEEKKLKINHWFTVDDLKYLRKGGRIGAVAAKVANSIGIKPVLHMNDEGKLIFRYIVRGRKLAIKALADEYAKRVVNKSTEVFISHGDCMEDVELLGKNLSKQLGVKIHTICDVGPVISGHTGPGVLSIFFVGAGR